MGECSCGFEATDDYSLSDHLGEVVIPLNDLAPDGQVHAEAAQDNGPSAACLCGVTPRTADDLDAHLLAAFTPPDGIGLDRQRHFSL